MREVENIGFGWLRYVSEWVVNQDIMAALASSYRRNEKSLIVGTRKIPITIEFNAQYFVYRTMIYWARYIYDELIARVERLERRQWMVIIYLHTNKKGDLERYNERKLWIRDWTLADLKTMDEEESMWHSESAIMYQIEDAWGEYKV
ncbi:uncharacterized protein DS421_20g687720 [Arachis hypogaea]|nr:uncharacterized protein DS421_20g687720 [Arachis hypogaea]